MLKKEPYHPFAINMGVYNKTMYENTNSTPCKYLNKFELHVHSSLLDMGVNDTASFEQRGTV